MCNPACIEFGLKVLKTEDVAGKAVIEVGSINYDGSLRSNVEALGPSSYVGVDFETGPGVDQICLAENLISTFGRDSFDVLISTELMEHVQDWRSVTSNFKNVLKPGGVLLLTTRSKGYGYHGAPFDFWRYETSDMQAMYADFDIEDLEVDPQHPGVFIKARKPESFSEIDLTDYALYSIVTNRLSKTISGFDLKLVKARLASQRVLVKMLPRPVKRVTKKLMMLKGKRFWLTTHY